MVTTQPRGRMGSGIQVSASFHNEFGQMNLGQVDHRTTIPDPFSQSRDPGLRNL